jgi:hypothetical protein
MRACFSAQSDRSERDPAAGSASIGFSPKKKKKKKKKQIPHPRIRIAEEFEGGVR